ncbi:MAG: winged helix-turn-helix domain-containing protein [Thermoplasmata archaeon]
MNDLKVVYDPETAKLLMDETRQDILKLLKIKALSIKDLSSILDKDVSTIYRHIKKLEKKNIVMIVGSRKKRNVEEKLYKRTYSTYVLSPELFISDHSALVDEKKSRYNRIKYALENIGFKIENNEQFEKLFFNLESTVIKEIEKLDRDLDLNTLNNLETILFIKLVKPEEFQNIRNLIVKK